MMKNLSAFCLAAAGLSSCGMSNQKTLSEDPALRDNVEEKPNIVILLTDDQGYGDLNCYGNAGLRTPNIDRLAKEGIRFTNFYAGAAASTPSRASLLTGRYAERTGLPDVVDDRSSNGLKPTELTLADYLKQNGYATGMFGKWHLGYQPEYMPTRHGFTEFWGIPYSNDMWPFHPQPDHAYPALPLYQNETVLEYNPPVNEMTTRITEQAVRFIGKHKDEPFLLYVPYTQPHVPLGVSDKFRGSSEKGLYADVISEIDWSVGEIMKALHDYGVDKHTLVLFTSDNGPWLSYGNHAGTTGGLREGKGTTFEGGQRVPFIAWMPERIPGDKVCDRFCSGLDITPTLVKLTGSAMPRMNPFDGEDVWAVWTGSGEQAHRPFFFVYNGKVEAVRDGKWKCVLPHAYRIVTEPGKDGLPGVQLNEGGHTGLALFDLEQDAQERNNVAETHPDIVKRLVGMMKEFQKEMIMAMKE